MTVVFALLVVLLLIGCFARRFSRGVRWLMIASICAMIAVITFTHYGG